MDVSRALRILDLPPGCPPAVARSAYRARMRSLHPDTGSGDLRSLAEARSAYRALVAGTAAAQPHERPRVDVYAEARARRAAP